MAPLEDEGEPVSEIVFDERLFRELEESRELVQQQPRPRESRGALALAAAWGLFLCVAGGLTAGLFGFREIAADALPGTRTVLSRRWHAGYGSARNFRGHPL